MLLTKENQHNNDSNYHLHLKSVKIDSLIGNHLIKIFRVKG